MKLKICGMKFPENIVQVANLKPDYLGFIFYEKSKRNFEGIIPEIDASIKKTGVFVNELPEIVVSIIEEYQLDAIQLHGDESVEYLQLLKENLRKAELDAASHYVRSKKNKGPKRKNLNQVEFIKVFGIKDDFNFEALQPYLDVVDYFLFDTKGKERGGNGVQFNWQVLEKYSYSIPYFLSGGIGVEDINQIDSFLKQPNAKYCVGIDVNSKFEESPGKKKIIELEKFKNNIKELRGF
ncbi:phosphoribosylanthranilate isomerase [Polaribacter sp.]|nr:phosphoribosylanthranilate isomerase [Polaribacter sp.]